ncbi:uncharacterized protein EURHEDRAFT_450511 [Aspergillus ruber CBS 135680]|uniref:Biogenesis of lysosome-related organelles complex 1 subunit 1 n=1 Tax=Aspergillus ruber (strain CBS 135680) TaxID=1388766 RepID=A0A017SNF7_ASPRC|nr:uncharacterized protein EURHEDRAFT_450511 [Aspergillus ruber CBS 135680]EYE97810.1 hypothetical protein EURHEDRAFT_450511 [Aspergillus ruber CBS 135680]
MSSQTQPLPNPSNPDSEEDQARRTTEAKTAFTASLSSIGNNHDAPLRARASLLHANATALSQQENDIVQATEDLGRSNGELEGAADKAREGLKEIGDVQNWAEVIERELLVLEEVVKGVEEKIEEQEGGVDGDGAEQRGNDGVGRRVDGNGNGNGNGNGESSGWLKWW